jgi:hypothetical protein
LTSSRVLHKRLRGAGQILLLASGSSLRITEPAYNGITCSAVSCTSTDELHERIYAPYGLINVRDEYAGMAGRLHDRPDGVAGLLLGPVDHLAQSPIKLLPIISWQGPLLPPRHLPVHPDCDSPLPQIAGLAPTSTASGSPSCSTTPWTVTPEDHELRLPY